MVALFLDFFADVFDILPRAMPQFREISGVIAIERNRDLLQMPLTVKQMEQLMQVPIQGGKIKGVPPPRRSWKVLRNSAATHPVPLRFFGRCYELDA